MDTPTCATCGFLTMRNRFTGQLDEMDSELRATGRPTKRRKPVPAGTGTGASGTESFEEVPYVHIPICFSMAADLSVEGGQANYYERIFHAWPDTEGLE